MKTVCSRDDYLNLSNEEQTALAVDFLALIKLEYPDREFGFGSFPSLRYDHMVISTLLHELKVKGEIASSGYMVFRLVGRKTSDPALNYRLRYAAREGRVDEVRRLLDEGADIEAKGDNDADNALMEAARAGHTAVIQLLLDRGANVNSKRSSGLTALLVAADSGQLPAVRLLLSRGADVTARMAVHGFTAVEMARQKGHGDVAAFLLQPQGSPPPVSQRVLTVKAEPSTTPPGPPITDQKPPGSKFYEVLGVTLLLVPAALGSMLVGHALSEWESRPLATVIRVLLGLALVSPMAIVAFIAIRGVLISRKRSSR
ncbi:MAG: ankyrin repeat domain-containing protein [Candidatus Aminicenantes bacterium]|nr:ankyrin repeat domain-containing protein [Candidatus Aminicenantes bacterium]